MSPAPASCTRSITVSVLASSPSAAPAGSPSTTPGWKVLTSSRAEQHGEQGRQSDPTHQAPTQAADRGRRRQVEHGLHHRSDDQRHDEHAQPIEKELPEEIDDADESSAVAQQRPRPPPRTARRWRSASAAGGSASGMADAPLHRLTIFINAARRPHRYRSRARCVARRCFR